MNLIVVLLLVFVWALFGISHVRLHKCFSIVLTTHFKLVWYYSHILIAVLFTILLVSLLLGSLPFNFILGSSVTILFLIAFISWGLSYLISSTTLGRFYYNNFTVSGFLFLFDSFVTLLRPVTLMLRVFINVSLGHFLIVFLHIHLSSVCVVWVLELFVYVVQSYVFMTLSKSYTEPLLAPSLIKNIRFTLGSIAGCNNNNQTHTNVGN